MSDHAHSTHLPSLPFPSSPLPFLPPKVSVDLCRVFQQCCVGDVAGVREFITRAGSLPHQVIREGGARKQDGRHQEDAEGDISPVSDDGDEHMLKNEGCGHQTVDEDEGCRMMDGGNDPQSLGCKVEGQMDGLSLQDPVQNGKDASGSEDADKDDEGWTVVSSKRKGQHKR